jgi:hypothetical protein
MQALSLLSAYVEEGASAIVPSLVESEDVQAFCRLAQIGALIPASAPHARLCPRCDYRVVHVERDGIARCNDCGVIDPRTVDVVRLAPDMAWLLHHLAQALHLESAPALPMGNEHLWRLGDLGEGAARRRLIFGRQLARSEVERALHASLPLYLGDVPGILITTTPPELVDDGGLPMPIVWVPAAFRIHGTGLVADDALWRGRLRFPSVDSHRLRRGPFSSDFRAVWLPGELRAIDLTPKQASLLRVLWEQQGARLPGDELMRRIDSEGDKPVEIFKKATYPDAHRAYRVLVRNQDGHYWLPRD